jgi:hypothetical protein
MGSHRTEQIETQISRRGAVGFGRLRVFLEVVRREGVLLLVSSWKLSGGRACSSSSTNVSKKRQVRRAMSRNERISWVDRVCVVVTSEGELIRHATAGASTQRRMNGVATAQAPGLSTTQSEPAPRATTTPQRRSL